MATKSKFAQTAPAAAAKMTVAQSNADALRKLRATPKASKVKAEPIQAAPTVETPNEVSQDTLFERMRAAAEDYFASINQPTWTRRLTSFALGMLTYGGVFYLSMQLVDMLVAATMLYSGVGFISFMAAFLGIIAALIAATTVGVYMYEFAMAFEASRVRDRFNSWVDSARARFIRTSPVEA